MKTGGEGRIRTCEVIDSRFTVCPRWPLGYLSSALTSAITSRSLTLQIPTITDSFKNGADYGTRTRNLLITNQLLYQLS